MFHKLSVKMIQVGGDWRLSPMRVRASSGSISFRPPQGSETLWAELERWNPEARFSNADHP